MSPRLRRLLTGISYRQEYLCLPRDDLPDALRVHLTTRDSSGSEDISARHAFVGYQPAIVALPMARGRAAPATLCLNFGSGSFAPGGRWRGFPTGRGNVAQLVLDRLHECTVDDAAVAFYRGVAGRHRFIGAVHRGANRLLRALKKNPPGNIELAGNLYDQVRILYSVPRVISLISVGGVEALNLFPTDLHGPLGELHYVSSLRIGGLACQQVQEARRIVLSEIDATAFRQAYALGKNHMKAMAPADTFELHPTRSTRFGLPLPAAVVRYRELEWQQHFDAGLHRIFVYRVVHSERVKEAPRLSHVHKYYAQWRSNAHPDSEYLVR